MGKLPKMKKRARRAVSPDLKINAPTDLSSSKKGKHVQARPHVLAAYHAGISKKPSRRQSSKAQKVRQRRDAERADAHADTLEKKVEKSIGRRKAVNARRGEWEDIEAKVEIDGTTAKPALLESTANKSNIFRTLDVEGEKKTSELPYAYTGAKMVLPVFAGKPATSKLVQPPKEDFQDVETIT